MLDGITNAPAAPAPAPAPAPTSAPPAAASTPPAAPAELLDFGGRKVPATPETRALYADWQNQQRTLTQTRQELARHRETQTSQQPPAPAQNPQGPSADEFLSRFYDDPMAALREAIGQTVQPLLQPVEEIRAERHWSQQVEEFSAIRPDFDAMAPAMVEILEQNPYLYEQPRALEIAYGLAKAQAAPQPPAPADPATLLADQGFRQRLMADESLKNEIIKGYVESLRGSNAAAPVTIGSQPGGTPPMAPPNTPKTLRDGTRAFMASLGQPR